MKSTQYLLCVSKEKLPLQTIFRPQHSGVRIWGLTEIRKVTYANLYIYTKGLKLIFVFLVSTFHGCSVASLIVRLISISP